MIGIARETFTIIGAGIAGLTAALCLHQQGFHCRIFEKNSCLSGDGAGIQITPNAFHVLASLDLAESVLKSAHAAQSISIKNANTSDIIVSMPVSGEFKSQFDAPYLVIHRADLAKILFDACLSKGIPIEFSSTIIPSTVAGPLIGADGVWSDTRTVVNGLPPVFSGRVAYRALIKARSGEDFRHHHDVTAHLGPGAHLVYYPLHKGQTLNVVCLAKGEQRATHWSTSVSADEVKACLSDWHPTILHLVNRADDWSRWPIYTVPNESAWSRNETVLIGDAAHAIVPFLAQGGAMAIEDAAVLADAIAAYPHTNKAFQSFEHIRRRRVSNVAKEAAANGERYHWSGIKAHIRNLGLSAMGGERLLKRYTWIYGWRAPQIRD